MTHYSDSQAKDILREWPKRTKSLWDVDPAASWWLMARPKYGSATCPDLRTLSSHSFATVPDGMWLMLSNGIYADVMAVESCASPQNLSDKRNRYGPSLHATVVHVPREWLAERASDNLPPRWQAIDGMEDVPAVDLNVPVRHLRVVFFLTDELYAKARKAVVPAAHEFFGRHSSLASYNSQAMQRFLSRMRRDAHFYTDA